ncbi:MAG: hypothetical protein ABL914_08030 [Novosphingobium sp.]|uniref:hypothetical protein n=1 Tax=Novosphingobium sp. TaxID=1874826 RepID=UPI0032BA118B
MNLHFNPLPQCGIDADQIACAETKIPKKQPKIARDQCLQLRYGRTGIAALQ